MQENNDVPVDVTDLENPAEGWDTSSSGNEVGDAEDLIGILLKIGKNQERLIALMKQALEDGDMDGVIDLAKELVYGKSK